MAAAAVSPRPVPPVELAGLGASHRSTAKRPPEELAAVAKPKAEVAAAELASGPCGDGGNASGSGGVSAFPLRLARAEMTSTERRHTGPIAGFALLGNRLITAGTDGRILSFNRMTRGPLKFVHPELRAHGPIIDFRAARAGDKIVMAAACGDPFVNPADEQPERTLESRHLRLWATDRDVEPTSVGQQVKFVTLDTHAAAVQSVDMQQGRDSGGFLVSASDDGTARIWDLQVPTEIVTIAHKQPVNKALFFPSSTLVVTTCADRMTRVWDLRASVSRPTCVMQDGPGPRGAAELGHIATAAGGNLATIDDEGEVQLFDIPRLGARCHTRTRLQIKGGFRPASLQYALKGRYLVCGCTDGDLYTLRAEDLTSQVFDVHNTPNALEQIEKAPVAVLRSFAMGSSQSVLLYSFASRGFGFGILREDMEDTSLL